MIHPRRARLAIALAAVLLATPVAHADSLHAHRSDEGHHAKKDQRTATKKGGTTKAGAHSNKKRHPSREETGKATSKRVPKTSTTGAKKHGKHGKGSGKNHGPKTTQHAPAPVKKSPPPVARFVVSTLNLPSAVRGPKSRLLPHPQRTSRAISALNAAGAQIVALQEFATVSKNEFASRDRWSVATVTPNRTWGKSKHIGNGIAWRDDLWKLVDLENLKVAMPGRVNGLNMPIGLMEHRATGVQVVVMAIHNPSRGEGAVGRRVRARATAMQRAYGAALASRDVSVIVAGDFNDGAAYQRFTPRKFRLGMKHGVDQILGTGRVAFADPAVKVRGAHGVFTDHSLGSVHVTATRQPVRLTGLPAPRVVLR